MIKQFKASPFYLTRGNENYKTYVEKAFSIQTLLDNLFDDWKYKDMLSWHKFYNLDNVILEIYSEYYIIKKDNIEYKLPVPNTIDEFIIDMYRLKVNLFWIDEIDNLFEPRDFLSIVNIKEYYSKLLEKMNKSYELT